MLPRTYTQTTDHCSHKSSSPLRASYSQSAVLISHLTIGFLSVLSRTNTKAGILCDVDCVYNDGRNWGIAYIDDECPWPMFIETRIFFPPPSNWKEFRLGLTVCSGQFSLICDRYIQKGINSCVSL